MTPLSPYGNGTLAPGIRARVVPGVNGLDVHVLEAGFEPANQPDCDLVLTDRSDWLIEVDLAAIDVFADFGSQLLSDIGCGH